jgi:hypothetical protein
MFLNSTLMDNFTDSAKDPIMELLTRNGGEK